MFVFSVTRFTLYHNTGRFFSNYWYIQGIRLILAAISVWTSTEEIDTHYMRFEKWKMITTSASVI